MNHELKAQITKTPAGIYTVAWRYEQAPLDRQVESFASDGLKVISPSQLAFAQTNSENGEFERYSRTTGDVLYDARNDKFVIFPEGTIRDLVGVANVVDANIESREYVIPKNQRDRIYEIADEMLKKGTAVAVNPGQTNVDTSRFGEVELTDKLYSNEGIDFKASDYGNFLNNEKRKVVQSFFLDNQSYAKSQNGPYVNGLRVFGPDVGFGVYVDSWGLRGYSGAFGVRFEKEFQDIIFRRLKDLK